jgi:hypothetical protein
MEQPRESLQQMPSSVTAPPGREQMVGLGVIGLPFASGDVLALRRFPTSSVGPGYDAVWHRSPGGRWTIYTSIAPEKSCPRYIGEGVTDTVQARIEMDWTSERDLTVRVPEAQFEWQMRIENTLVTWLMNALLSVMPERLLRSQRVLSLMSRLSTVLLSAGRLRLTGRMPGRLRFQAVPRKVWMISQSRATIGGRALGPLGPLPEQIGLADFSIPQRGVVLLGDVTFDGFLTPRPTVV